MPRCVAFESQWAWSIVALVLDVLHMLYVSTVQEFSNMCLIEGYTMPVTGFLTFVTHTFWNVCHFSFFNMFAAS